MNASLYLVTGKVIGNAYQGEDAEQVWTGNPHDVPEAVVRKAISGLADDYTDIRDIADIMRFARDGEDVVVARDDAEWLGDFYTVELQWREWSSAPPGTLYPAEGG